MSADLPAARGLLLATYLRQQRVHEIRATFSYRYSNDEGHASLAVLNEGFRPDLDESARRDILDKPLATQAERYIDGKWQLTNVDVPARELIAEHLVALDEQAFLQCDGEYSSEDESDDEGGSRTIEWTKGVCKVEVHPTGLGRPQSLVERPVFNRPRYR